MPPPAISILKPPWMMAVVHIALHLHSSIPTIRVEANLTKFVDAMESPTSICATQSIWEVSSVGRQDIAMIQIILQMLRKTTKHVLLTSTRMVQQTSVTCLWSWANLVWFVTKEGREGNTKTKKRETALLQSPVWYPERDLNPHDPSGQQILSLSCLPIPPSGQMVEAGQK